MGFNYKSWAIRMQWHPWNFIARHELSQSNGDTIKIYEVFIALTMGFALGFHENCMGAHASDVTALQPNSSTWVQHQFTHQPWPSLSAACFWAWCWHWWSCMWRWGRWTWSSWSTWMSWPSSSLSSKWGHVEKMGVMMVMLVMRVMRIMRHQQGVLETCSWAHQKMRNF